MIFSTEHNYIFIHIPKTGGTSVRIALGGTYSRAGLEKIPPGCRVNKQIRVVKHSPSRVIRHAAKRNLWRTYFKFAFVRNPWDWCVSTYHYIQRYKKDPRRSIVKKLSFKEFLEWLYRDLADLQKMYQSFRGQHSYVYNADGRCMANFVGRLETLQADMNTVCRKIGIPERKVRKHNATKHNAYYEYYDRVSSQIVTDIFHRDIELFKYSMPKEVL